MKMEFLKKETLKKNWELSEKFRAGTSGLFLSFFYLNFWINPSYQNDKLGLGSR